MKEKVFGQELKEQLLAKRARIQETISERWERINNCEVDYGDCYVSDKLDVIQKEEIEMKLEILETDGTAEFNVIFNESGKEVRTHWFRNKWGKFTIVGNGVFANSEEALCKKTGWKQGTVKAPVWVKYQSSGTGLAGAILGSNVRCRWHTNMVTGEYVGYPNDKEAEE